MPDIILVNPHLSTLREKKKKTSLNVEPPLGLVCMGTYLEKEGFSVKVIDGFVDDAKDEIRHNIKNAIFVGFSVMSSQIAHALDLSAFVREIDPNIPIVWGGMHPTLFPEQTLKDHLVDFIITKEGEETSTELAQALSNGSKDFSKIQGLGYKEGTKITLNENRLFFDINKMPFLNWKLVNIEQYIRTEIDGKAYKSMYIHSSRGCPSRCTFCINTILNKCIWRSMGSERVLDEIEYLLNEYKINNIWFREENFFSNKTRVKEICEGIKKRGLDFTWLTTVRADYFRPGFLDDEFVKMIKDAGCIRLSLGIESGSRKILNYIKKDETPENAKNSAILCNRHGIKPVFSFMTGLPTETRDDTRDTLELIKTLKKLAPKCDVIGPQVFRPYPGSELYDWCKSNGFKEPKTLREWADPKILMETGYVSARNLPWIKDPNFTNLISMSVPYAFNMSLKDVVLSGSMQKIALSLSGKFRSRMNFWSLPVEKLVYDMVYKKNAAGNNSGDSVSCE
jgi:radical SAM superfamily enzyme YgiQ (UPF0313 family)